MCEESYKIKHECVCNTLKMLDFDAFLFVSEVNRFWISGVKTSEGLCLVTKKSTYLIVDSRYYNYCKNIKFPKEINLVKPSSTTNLNVLNKLIKQLKIKSLILENDYLTLKQSKSIANALKGCKFISIDTDFLRIVKTPEEIKLMQKSADIIVEIINKTHKWLKPGVSELDTAKYIKKLILDSRAASESFPTIVCFGKNTANPHHIPSDTKLKNNQMVLIDAGCVYKGYCSDITRTFFIGNKKPSKDLQDMYNLVYNANKLGLESVHALMTGSELDNICRRYIAKNKKWGKLFLHSLGHGVGIQIHELPYCSPIYNGQLFANSIITIEPGVYDPNLGGVRVEDTVVVTKNGCISLTNKASKDFI